jgi:hypothetical protein
MSLLHWAAVAYYILLAIVAMASRTASPGRNWTRKEGAADEKSALVVCVIVAILSDQNGGLRP